MIAGAEGEAHARLSVITVGLVDRIETGEESGQLRGQILRVQGALDLACEVSRHIGGDVADQGVQAGMDGGAVGHGETLTGVGPPSGVKVADGAGWRTKANKLQGRRTPGGSCDPHAPPANEGSRCILSTAISLAVLEACSFIRDANPGQSVLPRRGDLQAGQSHRSVRKILNRP